MAGLVTAARHKMTGTETSMQANIAASMPPLPRRGEQSLTCSHIYDAILSLPATLHSPTQKLAEPTLVSAWRARGHGTEYEGCGLAPVCSVEFIARHTFPPPSHGPSMRTEVRWQLTVRKGIVHCLYLDPMEECLSLLFCSASSLSSFVDYLPSHSPLSLKIPAVHTYCTYATNPILQ